MASSRAEHRALLSLEQMLEGKTTLKTQTLTHKNIICVGTEILKEIETFMNSDKNAAVREADFQDAPVLAKTAAVSELKSTIVETEAKLLGERQKVIDEIVENLFIENKEALEKARKRAENEIAAVKYRCEVAEKKRSRIAQQKFEKEKEEALRNAAEEANKMKEEAVAFAENELRKILLIESQEKKKLAVEKTRNEMKKEADVRVEEAVKTTKQLCEETAAAHLAEVENRHKMEVEELNARLEQLTSAFENQKNQKEEYQKTFIDLKEDYKRFQNYTQGFCSDYLLK